MILHSFHLCETEEINRHKVHKISGKENRGVGDWVGEKREGAVINFPAFSSCVCVCSFFSLQ